MILTGEPGIGKTRTATELVNSARQRGIRVLSGHSHEGEGAPPFWPWVQLLRTYVRECSPARIQTEMGPGAADIAQVVTDLRNRLPMLPTLPLLEPEHARFRFFESVTTFLKNATRTQPVALFFDDLQWADIPSLLLLQFVARELEECPLQ